MGTFPIIANLWLKWDAPSTRHFSPHERLLLTLAKDTKGSLW